MSPTSSSSSVPWCSARRRFAGDQHVVRASNEPARGGQPHGELGLEGQGIFHVGVDRGIARAADVGPEVEERVPDLEQAALDHALLARSQAPSLDEGAVGRSLVGDDESPWRRLGQQVLVGGVAIGETDGQRPVLAPDDRRARPVDPDLRDLIEPVTNRRQTEIVRACELDQVRGKPRRLGRSRPGGLRLERVERVFLFPIGPHADRR